MMVARKEPQEILNRIAPAADEPCGHDCFADDRDALNDFARYYNNQHLSDISISIGEEQFAAHRLILAKSSDVFDRMMSERWNGTEKKELTLMEEPACSRVFSHFLRFLYCNHVSLHGENCLPLLVLADKYNVVSLKKVCIDFAVSQMLPGLPLKEVFGVWFSYSTKAYHEILTRACIARLSDEFSQLISEEWKEQWENMDRDQLVQLLRSSELEVENEFTVWESVQRWLSAGSHPERKTATAAPLLAQIVPLIRFPHMTADELSQVEHSPLADAHPKMFHPHLLAAYKYLALPLASRAGNKDLLGQQFLLRRYSDTRWDKRITISNERLYERGVDHAFKLVTRSCAWPSQQWQWSLKLSGAPHSPHDREHVLKAHLISEDIDTPRSIEYLLCIVDEKKVLRSVCGKTHFTKTRYSQELETDKKLDVTELLTEESPYLVNGALHMQITLRPID